MQGIPSKIVGRGTRCALLKFLLICSAAVLGTSCSNKEERLLDNMKFPTLRTDVFLEESYQPLSIPPSLSNNIDSQQRVGRMEKDLIEGFVVKRDGRQFWLAVGLPAQAVWEQVLAFLQEKKFKISRASSTEFFIETKWHEKHLHERARAKGLLLDVRYLIRLERDIDAFTNIFVTAYEVAIGPQKAALRADSQHIEAAFLASLQKFLVRNYQLSEQDIVYDTRKFRLQLLSSKGRNILVVGQQFSTVWKRLLLALDHAGIEQLDRNRAGRTVVARLTRAYIPGGKFSTRKENSSVWKIRLYPKNSEATLITVSPIGETKKKRTAQKITVRNARHLLRDIMRAY